jgi:para-nitrobenzyl esterase
VDGWSLPHDVYTIFATGKQNDVPLLIGSNEDEGTMFTPATVTADNFRAQAEQRFAARADEVLKLYPAASDDQARESYSALIRDQVFGWEMRTWARLQNQTGKSKTWLYFFSRVPPGATSGRLKGAYHSSEISYAFNNVNGKAGASTRAWEDVDRKLADTMSSYWVNFATSGDPNGKGLPQWPAYREKDDQVMGFGTTIGLIPLPHKPALDFFDRHFAKQAN